MRKSLHHTTINLVCLLLLFSCNDSPAQNTKNEWLKKLNIEILQSARYDAAKIRRIDSLRTASAFLSGKELFIHWSLLQAEYALFNFDSAYYYSKKMYDIALGMGDKLSQKEAALKISAVLLSAGMFKEAFESLAGLDSDGLNDSLKTDFYILKARSYFDLADYNRDSIYSCKYIITAGQYIDSCLLLAPATSFPFLYYSGLKKLRSGNVRQAADFFNTLLSNPVLSLHDQAIVYSTFSDIYIRRSLTDSAIILLVKAAIADIRSSTKETTAILHLATLLFKQNDLSNASAFIRKAAHDASLYGARQRLVQLSNILPVIESSRVSLAEQQKSNITRYAAIITVLLLFLVWLTIIIIRQVRKLKRQQREINQKNTSLYHLVEEKEWLLKEVHHRVKNNLHTINSLLESQSTYLENDALAAIRDSQHRVHAMLLLHQKLYEPGQNQTGIDMPAYLTELVSYLKESFQPNHELGFQLDFETLNLDISLAVPAGLILNEAITNAIKYAFPGKTKGSLIIITIKKTDPGKVLFIVKDNGIGLPENFNPGSFNTLGMKLMKGLSEDIGADLNISSNEGTKIILEFFPRRDP